MAVGGVGGEGQGVCRRKMDSICIQPMRSGLADERGLRMQVGQWRGCTAIQHVPSICVHGMPRVQGVCVYSDTAHA